MANLMHFDAHVRSIFENDETKFANFSKLMIDASVNKYSKVVGKTVTEYRRAALGQ